MGKGKKQKKYQSNQMDIYKPSNYSELNKKYEDSQDITNDLSSIDPTKRLKACIMLANIFAHNLNNMEVYNRLASPNVLSKLSLRLVDSDHNVRAVSIELIRFK
jgi:hypothetical protein